MALFDNGLKVSNLAIGAIAVIAAPTILPAIGGILHPLAKAAIKGGLLMYEKGREAAAEAREMVEDLSAEVQAELKQEREAAAQSKKAAELHQGEKQDERTKKEEKSKSEEVSAPKEEHSENVGQKREESTKK